MQYLLKPHFPTSEKLIIKEPTKKHSKTKKTKKDSMMNQGSQSINNMFL